MSSTEAREAPQAPTLLADDPFYAVLAAHRDV